jgi:hypothetical protein
VSLQLTRAANSETGTYTLTTSVTGGLTNVATGTFSLVTYQGSVTYTRGTTNSMTLSVTGVVAGGNTLTGTTTYTTSGTDQLSYAAFTLTSSSGDTFSVLPGTLTRSGTTYKGALNLVDGLDETYWPDYTAYAFQITDPNDTNGNGIPDLTDSPAATTAPFINASTFSRVEVGAWATITEPERPRQATTARTLPQHRATDGKRFNIG